MDGVPLFYLYGEPHRAAEDDFIHVERLDDRSRPSEWTIRPHTHADLVQLFVIVEGGGVMCADEATLPFSAPALLIVPPGIAHGFDWDVESTGWVLTLASRYADDVAIRHPALSRVFTKADAITVGRATAETIETWMATMTRELGWSAPGSRAAVESTLLALLVAVLRTGIVPAAELRPLGHTAALVARYRERIEARFRLRESVASHAAALSVSESALRAACARIAGASPAAMIDARSLLEAKRALLYSNLSVAQVGYAVGFGDPAYFSRFFTRHAGCSPQRFRLLRRS